MEENLNQSLGYRLKKGCSEDGKEMDAHSTAEVFHEFGKIYQNKCPCQKHFILSAIFFNAAISRQPNNHIFVDSLHNLCSQVLRTAGSVKQGADLLPMSHATAQKVKSLRKFAEEKLQRLPAALSLCLREGRRPLEKKRINFFQKLQIKLHRNYKKIMENLFHKCIALLGKPPCPYAIIGRGSLARQTVTPYSRFRYIIALEEGIQENENYQIVLNYFYWYDTLFRIALINLKETVVSSSYISDLNVSTSSFVDSQTTDGISCEEHMPKMYCISSPCTDCSFRQWQKSKVIAPINELLQCLKRDFAPCNALLNTCYISGYKSIYDCFQSEAESMVREQELKDNLKCFNPMNNAEILPYSSYVDIKHLFYNSTAVILSTIGGQLSSYSNPFEIVRALNERTIIHSEQAHRLLLIVALAIEVRLRTYMSHNQYKNLVGKRNIEFRDGNALKWITEVAGESSLADFFTTAHILHVACQHAVYHSNVLNCFRNAETESNILNRFSILKYLDIATIFLAEWSSCPVSREHLTPDNLSIRYTLAELYLDNQEYQEALKLFRELSVQPLSDSIKAKSEVGMLFCFCREKKYEKALRHAKNTFPTTFNWQQDSEISRHSGGGLRAKDYSSASFSNNTFELNGSCSDCLQCLAPQERFLLLSKITFEIGNCKFQFKHYQHAIKCFERSIVFLNRYGWVSTATNLLVPRDFFQNLLRKGQSYYALKQFCKAKQTAEEALQYPRNDNYVELSLILDCHDLLERCHAQLNQPSKALCCLIKQVNLTLEYTLVSENDIEVFKNLREQISRALQPTTQDDASTSADTLNQSSSHNIGHLCADLSEMNTDEFHRLATFFRNVQVVDLSNQKITSEEAQNIGKNLSKIPMPIEMLSLRGNKIKDDGAKAIAEGMHKVFALDMSNCGIGYTGAIVIGEKLKASPHKIKELNLAENPLGDEGITWICNGLTNIDKLNVSYCNITGQGAMIIGQNLRDLPSPMKVLNMRGNCIRDDGAGFLAVGAHNINDDLKLNGCFISQEIINTLKEKLNGQTPRIHHEALSSDDEPASSGED